MSALPDAPIKVLYMSCGCVTWRPHDDVVPHYCELHDRDYVYVQLTEKRMVWTA